MSRHHVIFPSAIVLFGLMCGCGSAGPSGQPSKTGAPQLARENAPPGQAPGAGAKPAPAIERKIIYSAALEMVVDDLDATRADVERLAREHSGYIAKFEMVGSQGSQRSATWTLKVPSEQFRTVVNAVAALGHTVRNSSDSQDVTEEFIDVQARVKNLKAEEQALNKLLEDRGAKLEDVLKVRTQIKTVRGEIESAEGRLKYLAEMAAMSTITVSVREQVDYIPPAAPTFGSRVSGTLDDSWQALVEFAQGVALLGVALVPWLPLIVIGAILIRWGWRRMTGRRPRIVAQPIVAQPVTEHPT